jgi:hypothetical protein
MRLRSQRHTIPQSLASAPGRAPARLLKRMAVLHVVLQRARQEDADGLPRKSSAVIAAARRDCGCAP